MRAQYHYIVLFTITDTWFHITSHHQKQSQDKLESRYKFNIQDIIVFICIAPLCLFLSTLECRGVNGRVDGGCKGREDT